MPRISIESILGGHSPTANFSAKNQFRSSLGIDPALPIDDAGTKFSQVASGYIRPAPAEQFGAGVLNNTPLWLRNTPKDLNTYVYDAQGSLYAISDVAAAFDTVTGVVDGGNESGTGTGNGAEYYDNYIYMARHTTIARYGPLDGTPVMNGNYWVGTLAQTQLLSGSTGSAGIGIPFPKDYGLQISYPNHFLHRHSDGNMYIADIVGNQGTIHFISTTKTTVEGDTNNGSTYNKLQFGYGVYITAFESYAGDLAIALYESNPASSISTNSRKRKAQLAFWDTNSTKANKILFTECPDQIITAMKNINGVLYIISGNQNAIGFRVSRFIGGNTLEELYYSEDGTPPWPGAIDGTAHRLLFGSLTSVPEGGGGVFSLGLQKKALGTGLFQTMRSTGSSSGSVTITSLLLALNSQFGQYTPIIGSKSGAGGNRLEKQGTTYTLSVWWSQVYRFNEPFQLSAISIPLVQSVGANMTLTIKVYVDDGAATYTLPVCNSAFFGGQGLQGGFNNSYDTLISNITGDHNFWIELRWSGTALLTVALPIVIDIEDRKA